MWRARATFEWRDREKAQAEMGFRIDKIRRLDRANELKDRVATVLSLNDSCES